MGVFYREKNISFLLLEMETERCKNLHAELEKKTEKNVPSIIVGQIFLFTETPFSILN